MKLNTYQRRAMETALPTAYNLDYMVLGLASEAGEVAGKLKKAKREGWYDDKLKAEITPEVADCLWYVAGILDVLTVELDAAAQGNLDKLASRQTRGTLTGSGDHR